jgi:3-hydroxybutyryl-CoA dehydrogenase
MPFYKKERQYSKENKMEKTIGVLGAGTMGLGIAQVAAQCGHQVILADLNTNQLDKAKATLGVTLSKHVDKGKIDASAKLAIENRIQYASEIEAFVDCDFVIEAIIEDLEIKKSVFQALEKTVSSHCILASNTSSLSIASIGSALNNSERIIGIHFFNPAPIMPLVEIVPAIQTSTEVLNSSIALIRSWNKTVVVCKDTPGFIVNRVARPFYGEALRIYEEGIADFATIDWAMVQFGGFKMGPFTLMDYIGNDVNYAVTESVFKAFYFDTRFKPSFTQKRLKEAGFYGRKSGRGFYDYSIGSSMPQPKMDEKIGKQIFDRVICMLINEAIDAVFMQVASTQDIDIAMIKGVNYPKGLLAWADEIGLDQVLLRLEDLQITYGEDRYRPNPLLRKMVKENQTFY